MTAATCPLLEEVAARLPTNGRERAKALSLYQRYHEASDLESLSPTDFLHVLRRAREDWEARTAQSIAITLQRFGAARKEER